MIEIRQLQDGDIDYVRKNPLEDAVKNYPEMPIDYRTSYTALWDGKIVGVGGMSIMWSGVGEFWLILSKDSKLDGAHGIVAFDTIRKKVDEIIEKNNIIRAQATARLDFPRGIQMLEAFARLRRNAIPRQCFCPLPMYLIWVTNHGNFTD